MSDDKKIKKALERIRKDQGRRFDFRAKQRVAEFSDYQKRRQRTAKTQERLLRKGLDKAGIDSRLLDRLHEKDNQAAEGFGERQMVKVHRYVQRVAKQRRKASKQMQASLERQFGNPWKVVTLDRVTDFYFLHTTTGTGYYTQPEWSAGDNSVRTRMGVRSGATGGMSNLQLFYAFVWVADVSGYCMARTGFELNGAYTLTAPGKCIGDREAVLRIDAYLDISQTPSGVGDGEFYQAELTRILDESVRAECTYRANWGPIDDGRPRAISNHMWINSGQPVLLMAELGILCWGEDDAGVFLDASSDPLYGFGIPAVYLWINWEE